MAAPVKQYKGILFDFDGVLARTMEDNFRAWQHVFLDLGKNITEEQFYPLEGLRLQDVALTLCDIHGVREVGMEELVRKKDEFYLKNYSFSLYPGVENLIEMLSKAHVPFGMVTAARRERLERTLASYMLKKFSTIITGENGGRGKPYPDSYLEGARGLGCKPEECIVVENALLGIQAAKAAGAYCIAIISTMSADKLQSADEIVESFADLRRLDVITSLVDNFSILA